MGDLKISEIFILEKMQHELDFVDIDIEHDIPLFIDPYFLSMRNDPWSRNASRTINSFFQYLIELLNSKEISEAKLLFEPLSEPNETCLGLSQTKPMGKGVGAYDALEIFNSIMNSKAVETGIVEKIEDCAIFVDGVGNDKISDMTTNIIRKHLIDYTQSQCKLLGIELRKDIPSGMFWDKTLCTWNNELTEMLVINGRKILLVPKAIVSFCKDYTPSNYRQHFVLNFLQNEHLKLNTSLVQRYTNKKGHERIYVTKKSIIESEESIDKEYLREFTKKYPQVFKTFRENIEKDVRSLEHERFGDFNLSQVVDYLIEQLEKTPSGGQDATKYHRLIVGILDFIFYPNLTCPQLEKEIHDGRKRIDITFDNSAFDGFFMRLQNRFNIPCPYIFVECKNYSSDPVNPELDQLSGRFSPNMGKVGLLLCRKIDNMELFLSRCNDTYKDDRGIILPIVDDDIISILNCIKNGEELSQEVFLNERIRNVTLR